MIGKLWAGVDIGGTKTAVVLSAQPPQAISRRVVATLPAQGPERVLASIKKDLFEMLAEHGSSPGALAGIGVSCGSPLDRFAGVIQAPPNLPTWVDVPIGAILSQEFGCRCSLENDANAGAVAEHRFGAGQGVENMVFLTLGTGLGAGIICDGRLYHGTSDSAGEIGHVRLSRTGPVGYNKAGSVEGWSSGGGIAQLAEQLAATARAKGRKTMLAEKRAEGTPLTARDVAVAAQAGDALARRILRIAGMRLGETLAILADILNPERIVIGGLALRLGDALLEPARKVMRREALPQTAAVCQVVPAALDESIGDVAALCIAMGLHDPEFQRSEAAL
jgi:glucokinase